MRLHRVGGSMNEVAHAFWNQDNNFWLVNENGEESIAFHQWQCTCDTCDLQLTVGDKIPTRTPAWTVSLTNEEVAQYLTDNDSVIIWNLETKGETKMTRKVKT